jgi:C-terminal processing protease CtpA/Prc
VRIRFDSAHRDDSDHYTFYQKNIPYLMLFTGEHADYHKPSDDVDRIDFSGIERIARIVLNVVAVAADDRALGSFRKECRVETSGRGITLQTCPPRLGIHWAEQRIPGEPFPITAVDADSPAQAADLRPGDVLLQIGKTSALEIDDLRGLVACWQGDLPLTVHRPEVESPLSVQVHLSGQPTPRGAVVRIDPSDVDALFVVRVMQKSPAEEAGLHSGDRILLPAYDVEASPPGPKFAWTIERDGLLQRITLKPSPDP